MQGSCWRTTQEYVFFVRGDSIVEKEFVFCYCLLAVSIFYDSTEFEHHISLNSESVHTPTVYNLKNMSCDCNCRRRLPLQSEHQTINATNFNNNRSLMLPGEGRDELRLDVV